MPILNIRHVTAYHYKRSVAFGEHRIMLRPRDDEDQKVLESELEIAPEPSQLSWTRDVFGNHVATACFADRASELRFESTIRLDHAPAGLSQYRRFCPDLSVSLRSER
jgi:transglutaminase-like putative cysteine protease